MARTPVTCPKCAALFDVAPVKVGRTVTCPNCGWDFRLAGRPGSLTAPAVETGAAAEDLDDELEYGEAESAEPDRAERSRWRVPRWAWAVLGLVLVAGAAAIGIALTRNKPEPVPQVVKKEETPLPPRIPPGDSGPPFARAPVPLSAIDSKPDKPTRPREVAPAHLASSVYLLPDDASPQERFGADPFEREISRQALWLAAHDDFGLLVRDASLGETVPDGLPGDHQFRFRHVSQMHWAVLLGQGKTEQKLWSGQLYTSQYSVNTALNIFQADFLSRQFFRKCLIDAGFELRPVRLSDAEVPAEASRLLEEMRETSQFAAIRLMHAEMREKGESTALLAGLSRGYANLGLLTEFHWNDAPLVFKARGLLYTQRLLTRAPTDPLARRQRAYVAALAGLHKLALEDLGSAEVLVAAKPNSPAPPEWVEAIDAYVHFDLKRLAAAKAKSDTPLSRLLLFLAAEAPEAPLSTIRAGRIFLDADPECYLVHDLICRTGGIAHLHGATLAGPAVFTENLPRRLKEMPGLPAPVRKILEDKEIEPEIYEALRAAGRDSADHGEPSWTALGNILQEVRFTQLSHRLDFMARKWFVDTGETAQEAVTVLRGHPLLSFIKSYSTESRRDPAEVRRLLLATPISEVDLRAMAYGQRLVRVDPPAAQVWYQRAAFGHGLLLPDLARSTSYFPDGSAEQRGQEYLLRNISPFSPVAVALRARYAGPDVVAKLPEFEKNYLDHAVVQRALGYRHQADGRLPDAIRCWKKWVELSQSEEALRCLAKVYLAQGNEDLWLQTLESALEEEDTGLVHSRVRADIAEHYMSKKEFKRAEPYAMKSAESGAQWALLCVAHCKVGLGQWEQATEFFRSATDRYGQSAFEWYFTCRVYPKLDRAPAEEQVREYLREYGVGSTAGEMYRTGRFYLLVGKMKEAHAAFGKSAAADPKDLALLFAALSADALGDKAARDRYLAQVDALDNKMVLRRLGPVLQNWLKEGKPPDEAAVDAAFKGMAPIVQSQSEFFVAWYLANRGLKDRAVTLWKRCAEAKPTTEWLETHARASLEASGANQK